MHKKELNRPDCNVTFKGANVKRPRIGEARGMRATWDDRSVLQIDLGGSYPYFKIIFLFLKYDLHQPTIFINNGRWGRRGINIRKSNLYLSSPNTRG